MARFSLDWMSSSDFDSPGSSVVDHSLIVLSEAYLENDQAKMLLESSRAPTETK